MLLKLTNFFKSSKSPSRAAANSLLSNRRVSVSSAARRSLFISRPDSLSCTISLGKRPSPLIMLTSALLCNKSITKSWNKKECVYSYLSSLNGRTDYYSIFSYDFFRLNLSPFSYSFFTQLTSLPINDALCNGVSPFSLIAFTSALRDNKHSTTSL